MRFLPDYAACFCSEMLECLPHWILGLLHHIFTRVCCILKLLHFVLLILLRDELAFQELAFFLIFLKIRLYHDLKIFTIIQVAYVFARYLVVFYFFNLNELKCEYFLVLSYEYFLFFIFKLENFLFIYLLNFLILFIDLFTMVQTLIHSTIKL